MARMVVIYRTFGVGQSYALSSSTGIKNASLIRSQVS
jgi:hypothetical protein